MLNLLRRLWYGFFTSFGNLFLWIGSWGRPRPALPNFEGLQPLAVEEIEELDNFLRHHNVHRGYVADINALDGFLTCILIGPGPIHPASWLDFLFQHEHKAIPADELSYQYQLIARFYNMIARQLSGQQPVYEALMKTKPPLDLAFVPLKAPLYAWCEGFMTATVLRDEAWETMLLGDAQQRMWLQPIWEYVSDDEEGSGNGKGRKKRPTSGLTVSQLSKAVLNMRAYWIQHPYN